MQTDQFRTTAVLVRLQKKPRHLKQVAGFWRRPTLARPIAVLPSGLQRFTAVFGMGTGGATALLSPEVRAGLALNRIRGFFASQQRKPMQTSGDRRPLRRTPCNFSPRSATAATTFSKEHDFQSAIANRKSQISYDSLISTYRFSENSAVSDRGYNFSGISDPGYN